jgi:hypothetical protein
MLVRLLTTLAGPAGTFRPGVVDLPAAQAAQLVEAGYAERMPQPVESAAIQPAATAMIPPPPKRKAKG